MRLKVETAFLALVFVTVVSASPFAPTAGSPVSFGAGSGETPLAGGGNPDHAGHTFSAFSLVAPSLDGAIVGTEWADADCFGQFVLTADGVTGSNVTVCEKNTAASLYLLVQISDQDYSNLAEPCHDFVNVLFDNNHDGVVDKGDNQWSVRFDGVTADAFNPTGISGWSSWDTFAGGTNDLGAGIKHSNPVSGGIGIYTVEYGAPLNSGDAAHDFALAAGDTVGFVVEHPDGEPSVLPCQPNQSVVWPASGAMQWADIVVAAGPIPGAVEHFKCYDVTPQHKGTVRPRVVSLSDQFEKVQAYVNRADQLCNPVSKNGEAVRDRSTHLVCYRLKDVPGTPPFAPINVTIKNQFGTQAWTVVHRDSLCLPSEKNNDGPVNPLVDHFKCYAARLPAGTKGLHVLVTLKDQFSGVRAFVGKPDVLCNPVSKNGEPIHDKETHLACYDIKEIHSNFKPRKVVVRNQFGIEGLKVRQPATLCVPSEKIVRPPPPAFDHFLCYRAVLANNSQFLPVNVTLLDQFGNFSSVALGPQRLCNPVSKNGGPVPDKTTHLACYVTKDLGPPFATRNVAITNQFENATWFVEGPQSLCLPAEKNGEQPVDFAFNHFRCYQANDTTPFPPRTVSLADQFGNGSAVVVANDPSGAFLVTLCNPVSKNGSPVRDPAYHLACYRIDPLYAFQPRQVRVRDQFGQWTWNLLTPETLCVPSTKAG